MITLQYWSFLGWFEEILIPLRLMKETMSSLFAIIQEETFNQWQMKKKIQQKILNDIFYN